MIATLLLGWLGLAAGLLAAGAAVDGRLPVVVGYAALVGLPALGLGAGAVVDGLLGRIV